MGFLPFNSSLTIQICTRGRSLPPASTDSASLAARSIAAVALLSVTRTPSFVAGKIANSLKLTTSIRWTGTAVHRRGRGQHRRDRPSSPISCRRDRSAGTARSPWRASPSTSWPSAGAARSTIKQLRKITHIATIPRSSRSTFEDDQIKQRALSNLGPGLAVGLSLPDHGTLDPVMAYKAESGDQSADEYAPTTRSAIAPIRADHDRWRHRGFLRGRLRPATPATAVKS
ncbi:hypothetical protein EB231_31885 [Mesorhizobium sp. NZP2298]|nr:hypothetical protein EB231_31885 [Mesorhizobium sp. NZP2298]